jgi:DtxR family Mn-dependent transcriptional regulator
MSPLPISASLQDYLEVIHELSRSQGPVRVTDIAVRLDLAKASVTQAVTVLREQGLVEQERYGPVALTEKGRRYALTVSHRHTVLSSFLVEVLGLDRETAEKDACRMEHAVSGETIDRLVAFLIEGGYFSTGFVRPGE